MIKRCLRVCACWQVASVVILKCKYFVYVRKQTVANFYRVRNMEKNF